MNFLGILFGMYRFHYQVVAVLAGDLGFDKRPGMYGFALDQAEAVDVGGLAVKAAGCLFFAVFIDQNRKLAANSGFDLFKGYRLLECHDLIGAGLADVMRDRICQFGRGCARFREKGKTAEGVKFDLRIKSRSSLNCGSVSPGKPAITVVRRTTSGIALRNRSINSVVLFFVWPRCMALSISSLMCWTGIST